MLVLSVNLVLLVLLYWGLHRNHDTDPGGHGQAGSHDVPDRDLERLASELRARY